MITLPEATASVTANIAMTLLKGKWKNTLSESRKSKNGLKKNPLQFLQIRFTSDLDQMLQ